MHIQIHIRSFDTITLKLYTLFLLRCLKKANCCSLLSLSFLPTHTKRITLLKSPHIHKKALEQFELKTKKVCLSIVSTHSRLRFFSLFLINKPKNIKITVRMKNLCKKVV